MTDYHDAWDELLIESSVEPNGSSQNFMDKDSNDPRLTRLSQVVKSHIYAKAKSYFHPCCLEDIEVAWSSQSGGALFDMYSILGRHACC